MLNRMVRFCILAYQKAISPLLPSRCRFAPTCSQYCYEAFGKLPFLSALSLSVSRLLRCHPWNPGGWDPVRRNS